MAVSDLSAVLVNRVEFGFGGRRKGCGFGSSGGQVSGLLRRRGGRDVTEAGRGGLQRQRWRSSTTSDRSDMECELGGGVLEDRRRLGK